MASDNRLPMSADLLRQRRNLLVTSLALTAIQLAGATLKNNVSVLGASLEFTNPERVVWGLWILWAYFLLRYWQYLKEAPNLGIRDAIEGWIFDRPHSQRPVNQPQLDIEWISSWRWNLLETVMYTPGEGVEQISADPQGLFIKARWTMRAFISVAIKTPRVTDYFLPIVVAAIPLLLAAWSYVALPEIK